MRKLKKIFKRKIFYAFLLLLIIFFPVAIYLDAEVERKAVVTAMGIDKTENGIEVSALIVVPNKNGSTESVQLVSEEEKDIASAVNKISLSLGKVLGLAHCEAIVFGEEIMKENLALQMDFFIRSNNMATNAAIVNCDTTAKDLLGAIATNNNDLALSLRNLINFNDEYLFTSKTDIETFYKKYFSESNGTFVPIISIEQSDQESSSLGGGSSGGSTGSSGQSQSGESTSAGGSGGGSSGGSSSSSKKKVKSEGRTAILRKGVKIREISKEEIAGYNFLSKETKKSNLTIEGVTDENFVNAKINFEVVRKSVSTKVKFDGDQPYYDVEIKLTFKLDSAESEDYSAKMQDSTKQYLTPEVREKLTESIKGKINKVFEEMRANKTDTLEIARDFDRFHNKKWKKFLSTLEDKENFLDALDFRVSLKMTGKL